MDAEVFFSPSLSSRPKWHSLSCAAFYDRAQFACWCSGLLWAGPCSPPLARCGCVCVGESAGECWAQGSDCPVELITVAVESGWLANAMVVSCGESHSCVYSGSEPSVKMVDSPFICALIRFFKGSNYIVRPRSDSVSTDWFLCLIAVWDCPTSLSGSIWRVCSGWPVKILSCALVNSTQLSGSYTSTAASCYWLLILLSLSPSLVSSSFSHPNRREKSTSNHL